MRTQEKAIRSKKHKTFTLLNFISRENNMLTVQKNQVEEKKRKTLIHWGPERVKQHYRQMMPSSGVISEAVDLKPLWLV